MALPRRRFLEVRSARHGGARRTRAGNRRDRCSSAARRARTPYPRAGITFEGGGSLYNTSFVTLKDDGYGPLDAGTNDHDQNNTDNLIEDV